MMNVLFCKDSCASHQVSGEAKIYRTNPQVNEFPRLHAFRGTYHSIVAMVASGVPSGTKLSTFATTTPSILPDWMNISRSSLHRLYFNESLKTYRDVTVSSESLA